MEKDQDHEVFVQSSGRETRYGNRSQDLSQIDQAVKNLVESESLSLPSLVKSLQQNANLSCQTKLIEAICRNRQLVEDMILFLLEPHKMSKKYDLSTRRTLKYMKQLSEFLLKNLEFYQLFFLMLEQNSTLQQNRTQQNSHIIRKSIDPKGLTLNLWFDFLSTVTDSTQLNTSLGYLDQIFIPFIQYQFSESSRVNDYYEARYGQTYEIWLISHFNEELLNKIMKYTHHHVVFKCVFTLVLVSLQEQEWNKSLIVLNQLFESTICQGMTSDKHIGNVFDKVKEVAKNINSDKNRTVFAFVDAIIKSNLVEASLNRLLKSEECHQQDEFEELQVKEFNFRFLSQVVNIYNLLLKNGIDKNALKMKELRVEVLKILQKLGMLIQIVSKQPQQTLDFTNGDNVKATTMLRYYLLHLINILLQFWWKCGCQDKCVNVQVFFSDIAELLKKTLSENRWNSIVHCLIQKIIPNFITTQSFKNPNPVLRKFMDYLIELFSNKKYVYLNSTRMSNQGDINSIYNICIKITYSFEGACKRFGIHQQYSEWEKFVCNALDNYNPGKKTEKNIIAIPELDRLDSFRSSEGTEKGDIFNGFIDQVAETANIREKIKRIDTYQQWKQSRIKCIKPLSRTKSFSNTDLHKKKSQTGKPTNSPSGKRGSIPVEIQTNFKMKCKQKPSNESLGVPQDINHAKSLTPTDNMFVRERSESSESSKGSTKKEFAQFSLKQSKQK